MLRIDATGARSTARFAASTTLWIILLALCALGFSRGVRDRVDWSYWRLAAEAVQRDGIPPLWSETYGYPPHVPLLWMPLTLWLPQPIGVGLYVLACGAMAWWIVRTVGREWIAHPKTAMHASSHPAGAARATPRHWTITQLIPVLLVLVYAVNSFHQNQLSVPVLFGVVLGVTLIGRGRPWIGGAILGATISVKLLPLPIVGILLVKRCGRATIAAVCGGLLFALVPCLAFYGPQRTVQATTEWLWRAKLVSPDSQIRHFPLLDADRSQALVSVLNRTLRERPQAEHVRVIIGPTTDALRNPAESDFSTVPPTLRVHAPRAGFIDDRTGPLPKIVAPQLGSFAPSTISALHWFCLAILAIGTVYACRRPLRGVADDRFYADVSLALLVGVILSPVLFAYYLVWSYPALAVVVHRAAGNGRRTRAIAAIVTASFIAAEVGLASSMARQCGAALWAALLLTAAVVVTHPIRPGAARPLSGVDATDSLR